MPNILWSTHKFRAKYNVKLFGRWQCYGNNIVSRLHLCGTLCYFTNLWLQCIFYQNVTDAHIYGSNPCCTARHVPVSRTEYPNMLYSVAIRLYKLTEALHTFIFINGVRISAYVLHATILPPFYT